MKRIFQARFFCHGCGLENTFYFQCSGVYYDATKKVTTLTCPSGCKSQKALFELIQLIELDWESAFEISDAVFH